MGICKGYNCCMTEITSGQREALISALRACAEALRRGLPSDHKDLKLALALIGDERRLLDTNESDAARVAAQLRNLSTALCTFNDDASLPAVTGAREHLERVAQQL